MVSYKLRRFICGVVIVDEYLGGKLLIMAKEVGEHGFFVPADGVNVNFHVLIEKSGLFYCGGVEE